MVYLGVFVSLYLGCLVVIRSIAGAMTQYKWRVISSEFQFKFFDDPIDRSADFLLQTYCDDGDTQLWNRDNSSYSSHKDVVISLDG